MKRVTQDVRMDVDIDQYIREQANDPFRQRLRHGAYSDIINNVMRAWMTEHKKLMSMTQHQEPQS
jgi:hypothetical protein